jgi:hypothetical protein
MKFKLYKAYQEKPNTANHKSKIKIRCQEFTKPVPNYFDDEDLALKDFTDALTEASVKFEEIIKELEVIQKKHNCYISYTLEGDTHGIYEDYQYVCITVRGYEIEFKLED